MNYKEQIKSPKWQKKRLEVLNLRGFKCEKCKCEDKTLHVHHRFYINGRLIHEYDNDVLQVLCEDCHKKEHTKSGVSEYEKIIKAINAYILIYDKSIIDDLFFIIDKINEDDDYEYFFSDLSCAFNNGFSKKVSVDIDMNEKIERLSIQLSNLSLNNHGK